jgi:hypothetical protein
MTQPQLLSAPELQHLTQKPMPPYTPTLDPSLPESIWYIDWKKDTMLRHGGAYVYVEARREPKGEVHYALQGFIQRRKQNVTAEVFRATDLRQQIMTIVIQPCSNLSSKYDLIYTGRIMGTQIIGDVITELPDRPGKMGWTPRRFDFAGRRFVWKQDSHWTNGNHEELWEVEKEWPKPGSKTGKKEEKTFNRRLVWQHRGSFSIPHHIIYFAGGMGSVFEEYVLAVQMARVWASLQGS